MLTQGEKKKCFHLRINVQNRKGKEETELARTRLTSHGESQAYITYYGGTGTGVRPNLSPGLLSFLPADRVRLPSYFEIHCQLEAGQLSFHLLTYLRNAMEGLSFGCARTRVERRSTPSSSNILFTISFVRFSRALLKHGPGKRISQCIVKQWGRDVFSTYVRGKKKDVTIVKQGARKISIKPRRKDGAESEVAKILTRK